MHANNLLALMNDDLQTIVVKFFNYNREYTYLALKKQKVKVDDTVIIHNGEEFKGATVVEVHDDVCIDTSENKRFKPIVCKINPKSYWDMLEGQAKAEKEVARLAARSEAKKVMKEYVEENGISQASLKKLSIGITGPKKKTSKK